MKLDDKRITRPGALIVAYFGATIALGTVLLSLPVAHRAGAEGVGWSDAFFTAASAVTVTGLVVVDTGASWSPFGELVLLALIQIGGLGIMTMAGFVGLIVNRRLGVRSGLRAGAEIGLTHLGVLRTLIRDLVVFVVVAETVVAALLTVRFMIQGISPFRAFHLGVFHAVSAFNNAGFSIFRTGLEGYVGDWFVCLVIVAAFVLGGLGFPVVFELARSWRTPRRWSLHTKVTLAVTGLLLAVGTAAIAVIEWTNPATMGGLPADERVLSAFFQSATTRTAGFNTLDLGAMRPASWLVFVPLMVIGASSASTGGGIKTSTIAVAVRSTLAEVRGDRHTTLFERTIPIGLQRQALSLVMAALATVGAATFALAVLQPSVPLGELLFEAASAFGTVGVSTGVTTELSGLGRAVVIVLMFIGRVGPITFGTAVLLRPEPKRFSYPNEELLVG
ncbi:MAG: TrkH family potassium uptake protein [Acidimicrobiales bacterium]